MTDFSKPATDDASEKNFLFPLHGAINLHVRMGHGHVAVIAADDVTEAHVTLRPRGASAEFVERITVSMNGPTLEVLAPRQGGLADLVSGWRHDRDAVDVAITVPSGTALRIATVTAEIAVRGRSGTADLATGTGAIAVGDVDGDLRVRSGRTSCRVERVSGSVVARSGAGSVAVGEVGGAVQAGLGSGDLELGTVRGTLRSRTGSGSARIDAAYGNVDLASGHGALTIGLPAGIAARVDVLTGSGSVVSDLLVEGAQRGASRAITIRARTGAGDVRLFRAA